MSDKFPTCKEAVAKATRRVPKHRTFIAEKLTNCERHVIKSFRENFISILRLTGNVKLKTVISLQNCED